ncbi:Translation machinery-associated protein 16 [Ceratocystis platani]|uniref:Translation machinery-associated protein 16 n=1 Tax=Ceratocystis fimbriata f. sp. platani TaxID=88771 RepID=A0A0F8BWA7_CERFI|nr:Translation machinery-associated protein 16 [Ceratocystis platani]
MPTTFQKVKKQITKKRMGSGSADALHEFSRDSRRLRKASIRDSRMAQQAALRGKREQPLLDRASFFQTLSQTKDGSPFTSEELYLAVKTYVQQYDEELEEVKKTRRAGRPPSTKEHQLQVKKQEYEEEFKLGFLVPDLTAEKNIIMLATWSGNWAHLSHVAWVRVPLEGEARSTTFPPKGF